MPKFPVLKAIEILRVLNKLGFFEVRQKGSHIQMKNIDGKMTTIPIHKGKDLAPQLLRKILKDIDIDLETFKKHI